MIFHNEMGQNFYMAMVAWTACFALTILISLATRRNKTDAGIEGPGLFAHAQNKIRGRTVV